MGVVTQPDRPSGRKLQLTPSPVKKLALDRQLPVITPESLKNEPDAVQTITSWGAEVAVVVAEGEIIDGDQPPGTVGGESTAHLIRQAREDEHVKALLLRVNSPGGEVFASELIRREVELTKAAGKPVTVSMGDVAASGGYWISMDADEIWAEPTTITGSIGIFGLFMNIPNTLAKIGVHTDGVGTTPLAGALDPRRALDRRAAAGSTISGRTTCM